MVMRGPGPYRSCTLRGGAEALASGLVLEHLDGEVGHLGYRTGCVECVPFPEVVCSFFAMFDQSVARRFVVQLSP